MIHNNEVIAIEEDLLNYRAMIRQFTLHNRSSNLKIGVLTLGASVVSCKLEDGSQECIVNSNSSCWDLSSTGLSRTNWISHVRGLDTVVLTTSGSSGQSQSIVYQLTLDNELVVTGKLKNQHQLLHPYFFNLNSVIDKPTLDGHLLHVKSSEESGSIERLAGPNESEELRYNFSGDRPSAIPNDCGDLDVIYHLQDFTGDSEASIVATLQYGTRKVQVTLNNSHPNQCRMRIRVANGGVSIGPTMMNEFRCVYKFFW